MPVDTWTSNAVTLIDRLRERADMLDSPGQRLPGPAILREAADALEASARVRRQLLALPRYVERDIVKRPSTEEYVSAASLEDVLTGEP